MDGSFHWGNEAIDIEFRYADSCPVTIHRISTTQCHVAFPSSLPLVELLASGRGTGHSICNRRLVQTSLGESLRYVSHTATSDCDGDHLRIAMRSADYGFSAVLHMDVPRNCVMFSSSVVIENEIESPLVLESVPSFVSTFGTGRDDCDDADFGTWSIYEASNDWLAENRWTSRPIRQVCPILHQQLVKRDPHGTHAVISEGTFSTGSSLPMGILSSQRAELTWIFQIEHNGAWRWETGEYGSNGYFALAGPNWSNHGWSRILQKNETFSTVPVSVAPARNFQQAVSLITRYRRAAHSPLCDPGDVKLIFNDYMNTLNGDPSTEKLLPLIHAAADIGAEVFCVDAGWYDDGGDWWPSVGEWKPSKKRFPHGLKEVTDAISSSGMTAGLWVEPESVGVNSPVAGLLPDSAFFMHHGQRVVEQERYQLDFRNPMVIDHMNATIDRLVSAFGIGYFKFDYNIAPGPGTDYCSDSVGDGLLEHNRAYLQWIRGLYKRHPGLIIESCSSGGMRTDFAQSSNFQLLSTSDQQDYLLYPPIAALAPLIILPEQAGNWAYPEAGMSDESFAFALTNTLLGHFFLSGYINRFNQKQLGMVKEAVRVYRSDIRPYIAHSIPFWPLGLPRWDDRAVALGLQCGDRIVVSLWLRQCDTGQVHLEIPAARGRNIQTRILFPHAVNRDSWNREWDSGTGILTVSVPTSVNAARTFDIRVVHG